MVRKGCAIGFLSIQHTHSALLVRPFMCCSIKPHGPLPPLLCFLSLSHVGLVILQHDLDQGLEHASYSPGCVSRSEHSLCEPLLARVIVRCNPRVHDKGPIDGTWEDGCVVCVRWHGMARSWHGRGTARAMPCNDPRRIRAPWTISNLGTRSSPNHHRYASTWCSAPRVGRL